MYFCKNPWKTHAAAHICFRIIFFLATLPYVGLTLHRMEQLTFLDSIFIVGWLSKYVWRPLYLYIYIIHIMHATFVIKEAFIVFISRHCIFIRQDISNKVVLCRLSKNAYFSILWAQMCTKLQINSVNSVFIAKTTIKSREDINDKTE